MGYKIKTFFKNEELNEKSTRSVNQVEVIRVPRYSITTCHIKVKREIYYTKYASENINWK